MKYIKHITCALCLILVCSIVKAQLYKIAFERKIDKASLIVEGKVTDQYSFWNRQHTLIYTSNTVQVYKLFKGELISREIEIVTQGGSVGDRSLAVSDVLQLEKGQIGMFFCFQNEMNLHSPSTNHILYDVYSSDQGFLRYDLENNKAYAPFAEYKNIEANLYTIIKQRTQLSEKIIDPLFKINSGVINNGVDGVLGAITSFSPASVHAGAINDPGNNILTINGSGFGNSPSGSAGIKFKDANNDHAIPDYKIAYTSPYIVSWADNKIVVNVPDRAGTGQFAVVLSDGTSVTSPADLQVFFSVLDAEFILGSGTHVIKEPRLMNTDGAGGYTFHYSTSTAGGGVDFTASPVKETFQRALATWKEIAGANLSEGTPTSLQSVKDDNINLILFDNSNTGMPKMAEGVLESTFSWFSACSISGTDVYTAQKTGFDILIRNNGVSQGGNVPFEDGPCFPGIGSYDLEMIILHELGHALNLGHINDDYEDGGGGYPTVNPSKLMHYAILDYVDRRSPDASAYQGVLYTITPQGNTYGNCGLFGAEMTPLTRIQIDNDECPSTFPSTEIQNNTFVTFDLVHATSNKFIDPAFTQVNCKNTGTSVTNNAYYAFMTGTKTDLSLTISGYTSVPAQLTSCNEQSVRMAMYDVASCPQGQSYPQPVVCSNFSGNGTIDIKGLQSNNKYLLYFDGFRNTKASFSIKFNSDSSSHSANTIVTVFPNPITTGILTVKIENATGSQYEYALFDMAGKLIITGKVSVTQSTQTFPVVMKNLSAGMYILKLVDGNGNEVATKKIIK